MEWHYLDGEQQRGPLTEPELRQAVADGIIVPETLVWREGLEDWLPCREAIPLSSSSAPAPVLEPLVSESAPAPVTVTPPAATLISCLECGRFFPDNELLRHGELRICAACKPIFVQRLREGMEYATGLRYASFGKRFVAKIIDNLILGAVNAGISMVQVFVMALGGDKVHGGAFLGFQMLVMGFQYLIAAFYDTVFVGKLGATPGKLVFKLRVVTPEGEKVTYGRALGRHFGEYLSKFTFGIGYLLAAFDKPQMRTLHDRVCHTRVIQL